MMTTLRQIVLYKLNQCFVSVLLGMCESIVAAALSRVGWRVLHLDR